MQMAAVPTHGSPENQVQAREGYISGHQDAAPDEGFDVLELDAQLVLERGALRRATCDRARGSRKTTRHGDSNEASNRDLGLFAPGPLHPRGDVARAMQHAPNVDMVRGFDVEHDVRDAPDRPRAQARQVQFHRVAR